MAGRKPSLTCDEKTLKTIEGLAKIQCTQAEAAAVLGCHRETFINFLNANPEARARWDNGLEAGKASVRRNLFKLSETNTAAAIWLSKQYLGMREPTQSHQHAVGTYDLTKISDADLTRLESILGTVPLAPGDPGGADQA
ncbi:MAG: hypothetical protein GEU91_22545 [Rhizobiales bacterium]|nr:hypothetical protein [Hyphomicrobiales bacterium]